MTVVKERKKLALFTSEGSKSSLAIHQIRLPNYQPRAYFDPQKLEELARTIALHGLLEPLIVRPKPLSNLYELVAGGRRYRAAQLAQLNEVPVTILELTDEQALEVAMLENLQREDLNPIEETEGILRILAVRLDLELEEVPALLYKLNRQQQGQIKSDNNVIIDEITQLIFGLFEALGKFSFQSFVQNRLPLLNLPQDILEILRQGKIAYTKARAIAQIEDPQQRQVLLEEAISQDLSLSQIKQRIKELTHKPIREDTPEKKIKETLNRLAKSRIWEDEKKQKKLDRLLEQIEALMSN
ncbi:MAG: ParB/RepB/Spo0J family partition protein [Microcystaceae cyanobacterium]